MSEKELQPACYTRHAEIDGHIKEGKFWRGVIVTVTIAGIGILIGQYNMSIENNNKIVALTSKLSVIADANIKRLDRLEDKIFCYKGDISKDGKNGI
jgi:hypothetical protein